MNKEMIITPLGTVSPYCNDNKNCPGFLIEYGNNKILLDCGNGISRYLDLPNDLKNLTIIISHLHKDHYGDLGSLAYASYVYKKLGYLKENVKVYIPEGDKEDDFVYYKDEEDWTRSALVRKDIIDFQYLMNFGKESNIEFIPYKSNDKLNYDDLCVSFSINPHSLITYSIRLENDVIKLVYSSDTGYNKNNLEKFAKNANLLICESSFLRGQIKSIDNHLYAYEAALIARQANVDKLLLTHFWPNIDKELYVNEAKEYFNNTDAAIEGRKLVLKNEKNNQ